MTMTGIDFKMRRGLIWLSENGKDIRESVEEILTEAKSANAELTQIIGSLASVEADVAGIASTATDTKDNTDTMKASLTSLGTKAGQTNTKLDTVISKLNTLNTSITSLAAKIEAVISAVNTQGAAIVSAIQSTGGGA